MNIKENRNIKKCIWLIYNKLRKEKKEIRIKWKNGEKKSKLIDLDFKILMIILRDEVF